MTKLGFWRWLFNKERLPSEEWARGFWYATQMGGGLLFVACGFLYLVWSYELRLSLAYLIASAASIIFGFLAFCHGYYSADLKIKGD